jgi:hypothetical protein
MQFNDGAPVESFAGVFPEYTPATCPGGTQRRQATLPILLPSINQKVCQFKIEPMVLKL